MEPSDHQAAKQGASDDIGLSEAVGPTIDLEPTDVTERTPDPDQESPSADDENASVATAPRRGIWFARLAIVVLAVIGAANLALAWRSGWFDRLTSGQSSASQVALDALTARVAMLEAKPAPPSQPDPALAAQIDALTARIAKLEAAPAAAPQDRATGSKLDTLAKSVAALQGDLASVRAAATQAGAAAQAAASHPASPAPDLSGFADRLAKLETGLAAVKAEAEHPVVQPVHDTALRRVVIATALADDLRQGKPFVATLAAAKPLAPDARLLAPLDAYAETGVPAANALCRELLTLLAPTAPATADEPRGGLLERLEAGAARMVRIERIDAAAQGQGRSAILARAAAAAKANDLAGAQRELAALPPSDRAPYQAWLDKADARDRALAASAQFRISALTALIKPAP